MGSRSAFTAFLISAAICALTGPLRAQLPPNGPYAPNSDWHAAAPAAGNDTATATGASSTPLSPPSSQFTTPNVPGAVPGVNPFAGPPAATARRALHVTAGSGTLPNEQGQVWREYDISPYTARVTTTKRPEQAVVDWILRETGYEVWHTEPLGILSASSRTLRVYHSPQMQAVVADIVERFVASEAEIRTFSLRVASVDSPDWRAATHRTLRPISAQTPGVCAWLMSKEEAALLLAVLQRRSDYRPHSSPYLLVNNGQATVISALRGRPFIRDVNPRAEAWQGYDNVPGTIDEGFSLEFQPLMSVDGRWVDAMIKCQIDQVEKLVPVMLEVPTQTSPRQRARVEVPQLSNFRFAERFRWPTDQVLILSLGVVALPVPIDSTPTLAGLPLPLPSSPPRADLLVIVESKGPLAETPGAARAGVPAV